MPMPAEMKRYFIRLSVAMAAYFVTLTGVSLWFRHVPPSGAIAYAAAILPALPIAAMFVIIGRLIIELRDEYIRMQMARRSLIATGLTLSIATGWGFLEGFGLVGHVAGYGAAVIWLAAFGATTCIGQWPDWRAAR